MFLLDFVEDEEARLGVPFVLKAVTTQRRQPKQSRYAFH